MVFGKKGYFQDSEMKLREGLAWVSQEKWKAEDMNSRAFFQEGKFLYSFNCSSGITTISADCEKF